MTGLLVAALAGALLGAGLLLVVRGAIKWETRVLSHFDGVVMALPVAAGDRVAGGALLVELES